MPFLFDLLGQPITSMRENLQVIQSSMPLVPIMQEPSQFLPLNQHGSLHLQVDFKISEFSKKNSVSLVKLLVAYKWFYIYAIGELTNKYL